MRIFVGEQWYYSNSEGTFREFEMYIKGRDYDFIQRRFNSFKEENPNSSDTVLYLNDKKNYLKFWNWYDYGDHPRWDLPYRSIPFMRIFIGEYWYYSNYDGSYREFEDLSKGRSFEYVNRKYHTFLESHPEKKIDTNLYINDKKNYLKFWNYKDYGKHPRWNLPYRPLDSLTKSYLY